MSQKRTQNSDPPAANQKLFLGSKTLNLREIIKRLHNLVSEAASKIPMYQALYGKTPSIKTLTDFRQLPIINRQTFAELGDVSKAVSDPWDIVGPYAPWNAERNRFPLPVLHNDTDEEGLIERLSWIMEYIGFERSERITFLVSPPHQYGVAELADLLIYLGFQCQIIQVTHQPRGNLRRLLNEAGVVKFFVAAEPELLAEEWAEGVSAIVTFNHPRDLKGQFRHFDILHLDEIPLLAVRQQPIPYAWLQHHFYFEESVIGTLIVTTLGHDCGPLIRYDTGIRARLNGHKLFLPDDLI